MALTITTTDQFARSHGVKVLVYGRSGVGKTVLCSTAPSPIILSSESGLLSLGGVSIPVIEIKTLTDLLEAYSWLSSSAESRQFATICIDSITDIGEIVLAHTKKVVKDNRQVYGKYADDMVGAIKAFRDLPNRHVYMAAKAEQVKNEMDGRIRLGPIMPGTKMTANLPYLYDEVFNLDMGLGPDNKTLVRFIQTQPDMAKEGKDRSNKLDMYEPANLTHIFNKIMGAN